MRLVLLGDPVAHSRSPAIQTAALETVGIEGTYVARRVDSAGMMVAVDEIRYGRLDGANVTMPHKQLAFELADRVSEAALRSGAVNTFVRSAGEVWGYNTDVDGIQAVWTSAGFPDDAPVLILGTGGAAAGAAVAVAERTVVISGRRDEAATDLLARVRVDGTVVPWGTAVEGAVVINATPLGMEGESLPADILVGASGFFDLTYGSVDPPSVLRSRDRGIPVADGRDMLVAQAAAAFEIWTGVPAPNEAMRSAL